MLLTKTIIMKWNSKNKKWYESKEYIYTKMGDEFEVKVEELSKGSHALVNVQCDGCGKILKLKWKDYKDHVRSDNSYLCKKCSKIDLAICGKNVVKGLNDIGTTHKHLLKYIKNKEDAFLYSYGSIKKIQVKCPICGYEKQISIHNLVNTKFSCPICNDNISYPEKFTMSLLNQLDLDYSYQKSDFSWIKKYRKIYDFYIKSLNCIIETHGLQHYQEKTKNSAFKKTLHEEQENDKLKKELAIHNGIKKENYIVLDCRKSELEWIKNSIMSSKLPQLLNFKEEDVDWLKCHEFACSSLIHEVGELYKNGINIISISYKLKICTATVRKYLKQATEFGICNYDSLKARGEALINIGNKKKKKIICMNTNEVLDSITEASNKYKIKSKSNISANCKGKIKYCGIYQLTGEPLKWMYYEDYLKLYNKKAS